ncbi:hypothetical protein MKW98_017097 [Papaver atlanticum]|uniref:Patatin n=1 Tax=Papaver atlanticum TaxID=357466 RepID=A0AAD4THB9_9MAGN|nr:hypothetical protein MKW98_017097 [Papaver atlanticum]
MLSAKRSLTFFRPHSMASLHPPTPPHSSFLNQQLCSTRPRVLLLPPPTPNFLHRSIRTFKFSKQKKNYINNLKNDDSNNKLTGDSVRKSFAVSTGELFLGLASRIIKSTQVKYEGGGDDTSTEIQNEVGMDIDEESVFTGRVRTSVVVQEQPVMIWDQKDFEGDEMNRKKETTPLAGSSAGAIVCAVVASGSCMREALEATKILAEDCRRGGTAFRLGAVLRNILEIFLPDDVHIRSNGRVRVAVTRILWRPRAILVDQFNSKEDLINAVFTSSFIPGYLAPRPATLFRNKLCVDGGLTLFMPPTSAAKTVRICAFPASRLGLQGIGISPDCNPENRATTGQLFKWALEPGEDGDLDRLFELGYLDAAVWDEQNPVQEAVEHGVEATANS